MLRIVEVSSMDMIWRFSQTGDISDFAEMRGASGLGAANLPQHAAFANTLKLNRMAAAVLYDESLGNVAGGNTKKISGIWRRGKRAFGYREFEINGQGFNSTLGVIHPDFRGTDQTRLWARTIEYMAAQVFVCDRLQITLIESHVPMTKMIANWQAGGYELGLATKSHDGRLIQRMHKAPIFEHPDHPWPAATHKWIDLPDDTPIFTHPTP